MVFNKEEPKRGPGWVAKVVRALSQYAQVGLDPRSGHIQESANEYINKVEQQIDVSLSLSLSLRLSF